MNRKGTLIFGVVFGLLIAIGIFFIGINTSKVPLQQKGKWATDFLTQNYLEAQKQLLKQDAAARPIARAAALTIAERGGFTTFNHSPCGEFNGKELWNTELKFCNPSWQDSLTAVMHERLSAASPERVFTTAGSRDTFFYAKGDHATITSPVGTYIFDTSIGVDIGYSFEEYERITTEAQELLTLCRNQRDLRKCLNARKSNWNFASCTDPEYDEEQRKVSFCVYSPHGYVVTKEFVEGIAIPVVVTYSFALDFSPTSPFAVEDIVVVNEGDNFKVIFPYDSSAEGYTVYATNEFAVENYKGEAGNMIILDPASFLLEEKIDRVRNDCPDNKNVGEAYHCGDNVQFIYSAPELDPIFDYLFTVTARRGSQESPIVVFVLSE